MSIVTSLEESKTCSSIFPDLAGCDNRGTERLPTSIMRKLSPFNSRENLSRKRKEINTSYYLTLAGSAPVQSNIRTLPREGIVRILHGVK